MLTQSWSRDQLADYADQLLLATREHASTSHAQIRFPGGYGHDVDGLEGFARTFLAAGVPTVDYPIVEGRWFAVLAGLTGQVAPMNDAEVSCHLGENLRIEARWPDGHRSTTDLALHTTQPGLDHTNKENR